MASDIMDKAARARKCSVEGCMTAPRGRYCSMHANRLARHGRLDLPSFEEKFWAKVDNSGGPDACWPWTKSRLEYGHGRVYWKGRLWVASRVAYTLAIGEIPDGLNVCHSCDHGWCCNPAHFFAGTDADNARDKENKGRGNHVCGEQVGLSKLTDESVKKIRSLRSSGHTVMEIAAMFGVAHSTIAKAARRETWRHVKDAS